VTDGVEGRLVPQDDDAALAAAIAEILGDPARYATLAAAARARVERDFSAERAIAELCDAYRQALDLARQRTATAG